ncbi:MAG: ATP-dependent zinc protease family protein [Lacipirellulaceae bacterium]
MDPRQSLPVVGWREWVGLPGLGIPRLRAKVDTGARTSSLHAEAYETFRRGKDEYARFEVPTVLHGVVTCEAPVFEHRAVRSSSGHETIRPVIVADCELLRVRWRIELTLADRGSMVFPMLLGRQALDGRFLVDSRRSYAAGRPPRRS